MVYSSLANLVLVFHLGFIVFVVLGGLPSFRWRWWPLVHLPAALWGMFIEVSGRICPLTPLENALRRSAGDSGYSGGFVEHYLLATIYPSGLSRSVQLLLAAFVVTANIFVYAAVWVRYRRSRARAI